MRDKAVENVCRDYEHIVMTLLVGARIGLAIMFEDPEAESKERLLRTKGFNLPTNAHQQARNLMRKRMRINGKLWKRNGLTEDMGENAWELTENNGSGTDARKKRDTGSIDHYYHGFPS